MMTTQDMLKTNKSYKKWYLKEISGLSNTACSESLSPIFQSWAWWARAKRKQICLREEDWHQLALKHIGVEGKALIGPKQDNRTCSSLKTTPHLTSSLTWRTLQGLLSSSPFQLLTRQLMEILLFLAGVNQFFRKTARGLLIAPWKCKLIAQISSLEVNL